jgi:hypothetical protein
VSLDIRQFVTNKKTGKPLRAKYESGVRMPLVFRASRSDKELLLIEEMKRNTGLAEDVHQCDRDDSALPDSARFVPLAKDLKRNDELLDDDDDDAHDLLDSAPVADQSQSQSTVHEVAVPVAVRSKRRKVESAPTQPTLDPNSVLVPSSPTTSQIVPLTQSRFASSQARPASSTVLVPSTPDADADADTDDAPPPDDGGGEEDDASSSVFYPTRSQLTQGSQSATEPDALPVSSSSVIVQLD